MAAAIQTVPALGPPPLEDARDHNDEEKRQRPKLRPKELPKALRAWIARCHTPYPTLEEKNNVAAALQIPVAQVDTFCTNYHQGLVAFA
jgi:hypothetical protein